MSPTNHDGTLADLIADALEAAESGAEPIPYEEICAGHPELLAEVKASVERASRMSMLQGLVPGKDRLVGTMLASRYKIEGRLGLGAMGIVYEATDLELSRQVAIKVVHSTLMDHEKILARFDREATALAAVQHDAVVTIYDRGATEDGSPFIVMEKIDGIQCSKLLAEASTRPADAETDWITTEFGIEGVREPSFIRQAIRWSAEVANGLAAAHAVGVHHRDVKPSNIMIRRDGQAVLLDFGIAAHDDQMALTQTDATVGTPAYMAPETLHGRVEPNPRLDVYGLSATLYHFLTLQAPFVGTPSQILTALATREPKPAFQVRAGMPRDAQAILDHGLARNPANRYAKMSAMESDLRALLNLRPVSVRPRSRASRLLGRAVRSKLVIGAVVATLLVGVAVGIRDRRNAREIAEQMARVDIDETVWPSLPANFGVVGRANRVVADETARAATYNALDTLIGRGSDVVPSLLLRSAFHWDHGDLEAAIQDASRLIELAPGDMAPFIHQTLQKAATDGTRPDWSEMTIPVSPMDRYLATFTLMRAGQYKEATPVLNSGDLVPFRHASELQFVLRVFDVLALEGEDNYLERVAVAEQFIADIRNFEQSTGFVSATTAHLRAFAHGAQGQRGKSLAAAEEAIALSPYSHVSLQNAAESALKIGLLDDAVTYTRLALEIVPDYVKLWGILARVEVVRGDYESAMRVVEATPYRDDSRGEQDRAKTLAHVESAMALNYLVTDFDRASAHAQRALIHVAKLPDHFDVRKRAEGVALGVLEEESRSSLFDTILCQLIKDPEDPRLLEDLPELWPETLTEAQSDLFLTWIENLSKRFVSRMRVGVHSADSRTK